MEGKLRKCTDETQLAGRIADTPNEELGSSRLFVKGWAE